MKAIVTQKTHQLQVQEVSRPVPGAGQVLVRVKAAGLCGSDVHILHGTYPATLPLVQGHEFSGVIEAVGADVSDWRPGQRVTADPNIYCHNCYYCLRGQENMCEHARAIGVTQDGAFAEYVIVPQTQLYELPEQIGFAEGALIEPLACVLYAVSRLQPEYGSSAIVFGAGPMGLLLLKALKIGGVSRLAMVDIDAERLRLAQTMGATHVYGSVQEAKADMPRGYDVVVDATGHPGVIETMFTAAARRAKILQFGCADSQARFSISPYDIYDNDWQYIGTKTAVLTYSKAIDMVAGGMIDLADLVSETVDMQTMARYLTTGKPAGSLKIVLSL